MSDEVYNVRAPADTLIVTPGSVDPHYTFGRTVGGEEFVGFEFTDPRAGAVMLALAVRAVPHVVNGLNSVLANIDAMRTAYTEQNGEEDSNA